VPKILASVAGRLDNSASIADSLKRQQQNEINPDGNLLVTQNKKASGENHLRP
jgi:hypothetical protein